MCYSSCPPFELNPVILLAPGVSALIASNVPVYVGHINGFPSHYYDNQLHTQNQYSISH